MKKEEMRNKYLDFIFYIFENDYSLLLVLFFIIYLDRGLVDRISLD